LDYYKIISISRPILARANMGLDFVSGQYGCFFSRCRKYVINSLIHGHFHIGLVIIPRTILALDSVSGQYGGIGMITRPIWKCPCINLYVIYPLHVCGLGGLWYLKPLSTIFQLYMWTYHFTSRTLTYNHLHVYVELSYY
jgi:hypothetical protein